MKKKTVKIIAFSVAIMLIVAIGTFANALVGNPFSRFLAKNAAERLIEENHPDKDFYIERVFYSFKDGNYHINVNSNESPDSAFSITTGFFGDILLDTYEDVIANKRNTADRICKGYNEAVNSVFDSGTFPYNTYISFGDIEFRDRESIGVDDMIPSYAIVTDTLELDAYYDVRELGRKAGHLVIYIYDEEVTVERLCEVLMGIKDIFNSAGVGFYAIDCVIEYPESENDESLREGRVEVESFLCEDIYEEGLLQRVSEANRKAEEYHKQQDELKQQEIEAYESQLSEENNQK